MVQQLQEEPAEGGSPFREKTVKKMKPPRATSKPRQPKMFVPRFAASCKKHVDTDKDQHRLAEQDAAATLQRHCVQSRPLPRGASLGDQPPDPASCALHFAGSDHVKGEVAHKALDVRQQKLRPQSDSGRAGGDFRLLRGSLSTLVLYQHCWHTFCLDNVGRPRGGLS